MKLVKQEMDYCKEYKIGINTKNTSMEHTRKIGFLTGVQLKIVSATWYGEQLKEQLDFEDGVFEVKK